MNEPVYYDPSLPTGQVRLSAESQLLGESCIVAGLGTQIQQRRLDPETAGFLTDWTFRILEVEMPSLIM